MRIFDEAEKECNTVLSKLKELCVTPENINIIYTLACACLKHKNYKKAIEHFIPRNLTKSVNVSVCSWKQNRGSLILLSTISEGIADATVFSALGELYIEQKAYEKAITFLKNI